MADALIIFALDGAVAAGSLGIIYYAAIRKIKKISAAQEQARTYKTLADFAGAVKYAPHRLALEFLVEEQGHTKPHPGMLSGTIYNMLATTISSDDKWCSLAQYHGNMLRRREFEMYKTKGIRLTPEEIAMNATYKSTNSRFAAGFVQWLQKRVESDARLSPEQRTEALGLVSNISLTNNFWREHFEPDLLAFTATTLKPQKVPVAA